MCDNNFKNYFKFPLVYKENFPFVLTNDGKMALTWCLDLPKEKAEECINKINGYSTKHFDKEWTIKEKIFIYYGDAKVFVVRGWGMLTGISSFNLREEKAALIQNSFAKHVIDTLNS
jgi:hypothetical protein